MSTTGPWTICCAQASRPVLASALAQLIADRLRATPLAAPLIPADVIARQIAEMQLALIDAWIAGRPAMQPEAVASALGAGTDALMSVLAGRVR
ncbi:hypothetical protein [Duganella aquatilis]|uniref:hypothetical protein n=1 Tax=Duganella aquatilis TaxID=2666082 RepID=UPI001E357CA3|nr:hypothetical protein [Duganella aquatilis]